MMSTNRCKSTKIKIKNSLAVRGKSTVPYFGCRISVQGQQHSSSSNCSRQIRVSNYKRILLLYSQMDGTGTLGLLDPKHVFLFSVQDKWNLIKLGPFFFFQILPVVGLCTQIETNDGADCFSCWNAAISGLMCVCVSFFFSFICFFEKQKKEENRSSVSLSEPPPLNLSISILF